MSEEPTVQSWARAANGDVVGQVTWEGSPQLLFELTLDAEGRLVAWLVRALPGEVVGARQLRDVPVGGMERAVRAAATADPSRASRPYRTPRLGVVDRESHGTEDPDHERMRWRAWAADFVLRPRTGAGGRGDRPYAAVAACYVDAFERGEISPVKAVAGELGFDETAVRNYLTKARERDLLTAAGPGRPGGRLTDKARALLRGGEYPTAGDLPSS
jgi:hypothetical protein